MSFIFYVKLIFRSGQHACDVITETEQTREIKAVTGRLTHHLSGGGVSTLCFPVASPSGAYAITPLCVYLPARVFKLSCTPHASLGSHQHIPCRVVFFYF